jgi:putative zinc finger/helix-turn-helix YgiT family protein
MLSVYMEKSLMPEYCLNCDYEEELELSRKRVTITVRGEELEATKEFYQCPVCGESFTSSLDHDPVDEAYRKYRQRHQLLQPEEIRQWREYSGLTPTEVSELLGWESTTLRSYEAGALQAEEHDKQLKWLMQQQGLLVKKLKAGLEALAGDVLLSPAKASSPVSIIPLSVPQKNYSEVNNRMD